jgi:hypothetical protein
MHLRNYSLKLKVQIGMKGSFHSIYIRRYLVVNFAHIFTTLHILILHPVDVFPFRVDHQVSRDWHSDIPRFSPSYITHAIGVFDTGVTWALQRFVALKIRYIINLPNINIEFQAGDYSLEFFFRSHVHSDLNYSVNVVMQQRTIFLCEKTLIYVNAF